MAIGPGEYTMGSGIPDPEGPTYDPFQWGGRGKDMANSLYTPGTSGAERDVDRYRQQGQQYGNTAAPGIDRGLSGESRGHQGNALGMMQNAAWGGAPSRAEIYGQKMTDDSLDASMSVAASARGGPLSQAAAMGQAQQAGAQQRAAGARDLSALRAQEMAQARGDYYGAAATTRNQDIGVENYATDNEARQRLVNQGDRQFYEQRAWDTLKQQQDAKLQEEQIGNQGWYNARKTKLEDEGNEWDKVKDIASGVGSFVGGLFSDVRAKEDIQPISGSGGGIVRENPYGEAPSPVASAFNNPGANMSQAPAAAPAGASAFGTGIRSMGGAYSAFGGAQSAYRPIRSDERSKYIVSDTRAKEAAYNAGKRDVIAEATKDVGRGKAPPKPGDPNYEMFQAAVASQRAQQARGRAAVAQEGANDVRPRETYVMPGEKTPGGFDYPAAPGRQMQSFARDSAPASQEVYAVPDVHASVSDERAKSKLSPDQVAMRDGSSDERTYNFDKSFHRDSPADQKRVKRGVEDRASKDADDMMAGYGASLAKGPSTEEALVRANLAQEGSAYVYKPEFTPPEQVPGEQNVGPMAQSMASDPIAATAVKQDGNGTLMLDQAKLSKLHSTGIASLQKQILDLERRYGRGR